MKDPYITADGKVIMQCGYCGKFVRLNKPLLGSLHICLSEAERRNIDMYQAMASAQSRMIREALTK